MNQSELRAMVRDVLREALPQRASGLAAIEAVRIGTDAELADFVRKVLERQEAIRSGQLKFTLATTGSANTADQCSILSGVVTEHVVDRHAGRGALVLAGDAVITPLARDRARKLNLKIERRR